MQRVLYPRVVFRTSRSASVLLIVFFTMALTMVGMLAIRSSLPLTEVVALGIFVSIPSGLTFRILRVLGELERRNADPDAVMVLLFDLSLMLPIVSAFFASFVMSAVR